MTTTNKTQQEFYNIYKDEVQSQAGEFTDFSEGSMHDILAGAISTCQNEVSELIISEFMKTFFDTAEGADLDKLAVDHFGETFSRPAASKSSGEVLFSRPNTDAGNCTIEVGTVVKTQKNSSGVEQRFLTLSEVIMIGLTITAQVQAVEAGSLGNSVADTVTVIETALTDSSITVNNEADFAGGEEAFDDAEYREWLKQKILALAGATTAAIQAAALAVAGVATATPVIIKRTVIDYDISTNDILAGSTHFSIPYPILYVADENGNSSQGMIDSVIEAISFVKACGVDIEVRGAEAFEIDWSASLVLNPFGPNYAEFQSNLKKITDSMENYINQEIGISEGFVRADANFYILAIWGPSGTNDITSFSTSIPVSDIIGTTGIKLVSGTVDII